MLKKLNTQILLGILLGIAAGVFLKEDAAMLVPIGELFLRLLKMLIVPLVLTSIIMGVVGLGDIKHLGKMGIKAGVLFVTTTVIAASIGIVLTLIIQPGKGANLELLRSSTSNIQNMATTDPTSLGMLVTHIVPSNIAGAMADGQILPVIFFALIFGMALIAIGKRAETMIKVVDSMNEAVLKMVDWIMRLAPIGVFALIASLVGLTGREAFKPLALYVTVVLVGLAIHAFIVLPSYLVAFGRFSPMHFLKNMLPAFGTAFSTSSSIATLPLTMDCLKKRLRIPDKVVSFVCPLGATINMDGTALYQAVASVFIAQVYGVNLSLTQMVIIVVTATLASVGAAAIPSAGLITMAIIFNTVGLPLEGIMLILAVDRVLDVFRTTVNVYSDAVASVIVGRGEES